MTRNPLPVRLAPAVLALGAAILPGCGGGQPDSTIRIGVVGPMTGDTAKQGADMRNGVQLAVDELAAAGGGLGGKPIEVLVEDDAADPKQAVQAAFKLANLGVAGVIGHFNSSCTIPASENVYAKRNMVMITPASTNPQVTDRRLPTVFRVCGRDDWQGRVAAEYVAERFPEARVAVIHDKTTYGQGLADEFRKNYRALTGREEVFESGIVREDQDFTAVLTNLKSYDPDIIYFGGLYPQAALLVKQARQLGIDARWFSGDGTIDPEFIRIAGAENAEGTLLTFFPDQTRIPAAQPVVAEYRKRYGELGPYSIYSYISALILLRGIEKAGTTDGQKVAEAIRSMTFDTPFGPIQFDDKGDVLQSPYVVWETRNGEFVQVTGLE